MFTCTDSINHSSQALSVKWVRLVELNRQPPTPAFLYCLHSNSLPLLVKSSIVLGGLFNHALRMRWNGWRLTSAYLIFSRGSVYVVAHPDDDLLFQSPDLLTDQGAGSCLTTIFLTSGDSGIGSTYAQSRESGNEAAAAEMVGSVPLPLSYFPLTRVYDQKSNVADTYTEFNATL